MFKISEFSSLNFRTDWKGRTNTDVEYRQRFLPTDPIKVQFTCDRTTFGQMSVELYDYSTGSTTTIGYSDLTPELTYATGEFILPLLTLGQYVLSITAPSIKHHFAIFCVVREFEESMLFRYDNYRVEDDTIFTGPFFFRVEAIVLPSDVNFEVSNEDFRDQRYGLTQLSSFPYEVHTLTVGLGQGVPNWVGRKLNDIFSCSDVQIGNQKFVRSEGSAPQKTILQQNNPLFVWKIDIEPGDEITDADEDLTYTWGNFINIWQWVQEECFNDYNNDYSGDYTCTAPNPYLTVTPNTLTIAGTNASDSVVVKSSSAWWADQTIPWSDGSGNNIRITYTGAPGEGSATISSDDNSTGVSRSIDIVFTNAEGITSTVRLTQIAQGYLNVNPSALNFDYNPASDKSFTISTNLTISGYTQNNPGFFEVLSFTSTGATVRCAENTTTERREGSITINTTEGVSVSVIISQEGSPRVSYEWSDFINIWEWIQTTCFNDYNADFSKAYNCESIN